MNNNKNNNLQANHVNRKLVVFDIDETLIFSSKKKIPDQQHHFTFFNGFCGLYYVYLRPYIGHLFYALKLMGYDYMFWSSGEKEYVNQIVQKLMQFLHDSKLEFDEPKAIWSASRCSNLSQKTLFRMMYPSADCFDSERNFFDGLILSRFRKANKPLKKVKRSLKYLLSSILIVDDTREKCMDNYGNSIIIKPFRGDQHDKELIRLMDYLQFLLCEPNVRTIEKRFWQSNNFTNMFSSLVLEDEKESSSDNREPILETNQSLPTEERNKDGFVLYFLVQHLCWFC